MSGPGPRQGVDRRRTRRRLTVVALAAVAAIAVGMLWAVKTSRAEVRSAAGSVRNAAATFAAIGSMKPGWSK